MKTNLRPKRMKKKASDLSMSVIIIAVLALLVLAVVSITFLKHFRNTNENLEKCRGTCMAEEDCEPAARMINTDCDSGDNKDSGQVCCVYDV